ncbi:MAG TPA: hypothetical protein VMS17_09435, partial [Gemmataceae bacterium]|nr:hypothetical protein [Gemmataceae bacterium]
MRKRQSAQAPAVASAREFARHLLLFDADDPATYSPHTVAPAEVMRASARAPIPWPAGKAPKPAPL